MSLFARIGVHLREDVNNNVYMIPGIIAFLQHPKRGVAYVQGEMEVGLALSIVFAVAALWMCVRSFWIFHGKSYILAYSMLWLLIINLAALLPKYLVYDNLRQIDRSQSNANIRVSLISIFRKRFYSYNIKISVLNVSSYCISLPFSVYLWQQGIAECSNLLIFISIYVIRLFYNIYRYNKYFLQESDAPITAENPFGFVELNYSKEKLKECHPRLVEDDVCSICMAEYEDNDVLLLFSCTGGHYFHRDCINKWMDRSASCPLCKHGIY